MPKQGFATASAADRQAAFQLAARVCVTLIDLDCARDVNALTHDPRNAIPPSELQPATVASGLMLWSFIEITMGHYPSVASALGEGFPLKLVNAGNDPSLFAELQLLAARRSRLVFDFEASRDHLDKALAGVLSMTGERVDAARLVVHIAGQLLDNYDAERALRLFAAAEPLLQAVPPKSFLAYDLRQLRATLAGYRKDFAEVSKELHLALAALEQLQLSPSTRTFLEASATNELLGAEVLRGDRDAARKLLQAHPLQASREAILQRGYFADAHEFNFAVADDFVRLFLNEPSDKEWGDLLKQAPRWTTDPERLQEVQAFGQAAIGLELLRTGRTDEARHELIEAGRKRLGTLQERYRKSVYASPLPYWTDQLLFEFAIAATLSRAGTPDYDLILGAHVVLNRSLATSADDALAAQALQTSDDRKRIAQSVRTIDYQRAGWEKLELTALAWRLASPAGRSAEATTQDRLRILRTANEFAVQQQRLHAALSDANGAVEFGGEPGHGEITAAGRRSAGLLRADGGPARQDLRPGGSDRVIDAASGRGDRRDRRPPPAGRAHRHASALDRGRQPVSRRRRGPPGQAPVRRAGGLSALEPAPLSRRAGRRGGTGAAGGAAHGGPARAGCGVRPARGALDDPRPFLRADQLDRRLRGDQEIVEDPARDLGLSGGWRSRSCEVQCGDAIRPSVAAAAARDVARSRARGEPVRQPEGPPAAPRGGDRGGVPATTPVGIRCGPSGDAWPDHAGAAGLARALPGVHARSPRAMPSTTGC